MLWLGIDCRCRAVKGKIIMCGIAGMWGRGARRREVAAMMAKLRHRGPDASGMHADAGGAGIIGHRRLSIMDPAGGDQPIYDEHHRKAVIANGEIYNDPDIRATLAKRHRYSTGNDSESVLHLYEEHASDCAAHLDGMFAFAVADGEDLFMARDPIGIKPLYYVEDDGGVIFASELKAFAGNVGAVHEFPPGTTYHSRDGFCRYYSVPNLAPRDASAKHYAAQIYATLERCVVKRLMSDVPLGAFLSGGLDSSLIVALARRNMGRPIHTFSVGIEGSRDLAAARAVAAAVDTIHHEHILTVTEVLEKLPQIIYHLESFDQDLVRSAIPCYFTSRLASHYVKVILTGEGADELFAGYTYYKDIDRHGQTFDGILHAELRRSVASLHNINLQRVDRLTMAHSIEGRVPFLDLEMIELGQRIPARLKLRGNPPMEKWILRKAFEGVLPDDILWRRKEQFDEGSGTVDLLDEAMSKIISTEEAAAYTARFPDARLRSPEECHYHRLFMEVFDHPELILPNVARWADRPEGIPSDVIGETEPAA